MTDAWTEIDPFDFDGCDRMLEDVIAEALEQFDTFIRSEFPNTREDVIAREKEKVAALIRTQSHTQLGALRRRLAH